MNVIIIGGGVGGLALAQGLKKNGINFHVYERDITHNHRTQGYRIRVSGEGIDAVHYLLSDDLLELFDKASAHMSLGPILEIDATTSEVSGSSFPKADAPAPVKPPTKPYTMDRTVLRHILIRGLDDHVSFGKHFTHYETVQGGIRAFFTDGTSVDGTLLVGADGSKSAVCKQLLPETSLLDTDVRCIYGKTVLTDELVDKLEPNAMLRMSNIKDRTHSHLLSMVLEPIWFRNRAEMEQQGIPCPPDYLYWVMTANPKLMDLPEQVSKMPKLTYDESADLAVKLTKNWNDKLRPVVENQTPGETSMLPLLSKSPDIISWETNPQVTLIGDSVHVMSPAAGSGAVTALRDAHTLCQVLVTKGQSAEAIGYYEEKMRQYAGETIRFSFKAGIKLFEQTPFDQCNIVA